MSILTDYANIIKLIWYRKGFLTPIIKSKNNNNDYSDRQIVYHQVLEYSSIWELKDYPNDTPSRIPEKI